MNAAISSTEVRNVQDCIVNDIRPDGRSLLQRRPVYIHTSTLSRFAADENSYNGSSVELRVGSTTVLAAASPSVIEVPTHEGPSGEQCGRGQVHIHIDAMPTVLDFYAQAMGGKTAYYRHAFFSHVALTVRHVFGVEAVTVQEQHQSGVAEAHLVEEDAEATEAVSSASLNTSVASGIPAEALYVGNGYAFHIDVDVHVVQAEGGSVIPTIVEAVHCALRRVQLPAVTLHEGSAGVSVEVDKTRPYSKPVDWGALPLLAALLVSPTHHYIVDSTAQEELALPQQLHIAASRDGRVHYLRYHQYPSRKGNGYALATAPQSSTEDCEEDQNANKRGRDTSSSLTQLYAAAMWMHSADMMAAAQDAVHICRAMIAECDSALAAALDRRELVQ